MTDQTAGANEGAAELLSVLNELGYEGLSTVDQRKHTIARLMTVDWNKMDAVEFADYLLFPDKLIRRRATGEWEETPIMLRVPRDHEMREARVAARALALKANLDLVQDRDLFVNLENLCVLAKSIRNTTEPHEQWEPDPLVLERRYDKVCLQSLWAKIDQLNEVLNPSPNQLGSHEIVALIVAIARSRNLGPLVAYGPGAQTSFVVSMADLLLRSVGSRLSSESIEHLIAGISASSASRP